MAEDKNHKAEGHARIEDEDLLKMREMVKHLPWLNTVLEEIQYLRNQSHVDHTDILDAIDAKYE
jgi:hypothetical protein